MSEMRILAEGPISQVLKQKPIHLVKYPKTFTNFSKSKKEYRNRLWDLVKQKQ